MSKAKAYIGDSVYAEVDDSGMLVLTTDNGHGASNIIYLESSTFRSLLAYLEVEIKEKEE